MKCPEELSPWTETGGGLGQTEGEWGVSANGAGSPLGVRGVVKLERGGWLYSSVNVLTTAEHFAFKWTILLCEFHLNTIFKRGVLTNRSQLPIKKKSLGREQQKLLTPTPTQTEGLNVGDPVVRFPACSP